jgi:phosphatidylinositol kinase/protein kinase (PI-3  family)
MGTSLLPVPELIPFRFTPLLEHAFAPLEGKTLARQYMMQALTELRGSKAVLANALEVYINDPGMHLENTIMLLNHVYLLQYVCHYVPPSSPIMICQN